MTSASCLAGVLVACLLDPRVAASPAWVEMCVTVKDASLAVIRRASVTITCDGVPAKPNRALTGADGVASFSVPAATTCVVTASASGFAVREIAVRVDDRERRCVDLVLDVAGVNEVVNARPEAGDLSRDRVPQFLRLLDPRLVELLPDDPQAMAQILRQLAGPDAIIEVDGFSRAPMPFKDQIAAIRFRWTASSAETHEPGGTVVEVVTKPGFGVFSARLSGALRGSPWLGTSLPSGPAQGRSDSLAASLGGPLVSSSASFFLGAGASRRSTQNPVVATAAPVDVGVPPTAESTDRTSRLDLGLTLAAGRMGLARAGGLWERASGRHVGTGGLTLPGSGSELSRESGSVRLMLASQWGRLTNELRIAAESASRRSTSESRGPQIVVAGVLATGGSPIEGSQRDRRLRVSQDAAIETRFGALKTGAIFEYVDSETSEGSNWAGTLIYPTLAAFELGKPEVVLQRYGSARTARAVTLIGSYLQHDVLVARNVSLGAGVRVESQQRIHPRLLLNPRARVMWTLGNGQTKVHGGIGVYRGWIESSTIARIGTLDGRNQQEIVEIAPQGDHPGATGAWSRSYALSPSASASRSRRIVAGLEQQWRAGLTARLTYTDARTTGLLRSTAVPVQSEGQATQVVTVASTGRSRTQSCGLWVDLVPRRGSFLSATYTLARSYDDGDGPFTVQPLGTNASQEWGPATSDVRHRFASIMLLQVGRSLWVSATAEASSGVPYTITTGYDANEDGWLNDRPPGGTRNGARGSGSGTLGVRVIWRHELGPSVSEVKEAQTTQSRARSVSVHVNITNVFNSHVSTGYNGVLGSPSFGNPVVVSFGRRAEIGAAFVF